MDLALLVYGISILQPLGTVLVAIAVICCLSILGLMFYRMAECSIDSYNNQQQIDRKKENAAWAMGRVGFAFKILIPVAVAVILLPTPKTAYIMVGAYAAQKVVENKSVQETSGKVLTLINQKLDAYIDEGIAEATKVPEKAKEEVKKKVKKELE